MEQGSLPLGPTPTGRELRDAGIAKVESHNVEWKDRAYARVRSLRFVGGVGVELTGEDIKKYLRADGFEEPQHHNGWSALIRRCVVTGLLADTGRTAHATLPGAHARRLPIWKFT